MIGFYFNQPINQEELGTYAENETELAFNEVSKSLAMISGHFNKGTNTISYLDEMNKGKSALGYLNEVNKGASTLNYLNEIENTRKIIFKN